jgi:hypothetical protein
VQVLSVGGKLIWRTTEKSKTWTAPRHAEQDSKRKMDLSWVTRSWSRNPAKTENRRHASALLACKESTGPRANRKQHLRLGSTQQNRPEEKLWGTVRTRKSQPESARDGENKGREILRGDRCLPWNRSQTPDLPQKNETRLGVPRSSCAIGEIKRIKRAEHADPKKNRATQNTREELKSDGTNAKW